jgi:hypothetical protein
MSAAKLIQIANAKGYGIGRERSGVYYYQSAGSAARRFVGSWRDFVKLVEAL